MNPNINVIAKLSRVEPETENIYTEDFFDLLDIVLNALDNVKARLYIDSRCVSSCKPLIESGTLGTVANTQIILPYLTETYASSHDPPEKTIPICTLKNFPNSIEHTLQWARDKFEGLFSNPAKSALNYLNDPKKYLANLRKLNTSQQLEELEQLEKILLKEKCLTFQDCVVWARQSFEEFFTNLIKQLLFIFPEDAKNETGLPFWSGLKRCPHALKFNTNNKLHLDYIVAAANIKSAMHGIEKTNNKSEIIDLVDQIIVENFEPKKGVLIKVNDTDESNELSTDDEEIRVYELFDLFEKHDQTNNQLKLQAIEFEKDDDTNFHMDFITACSNLRAENYDIAPTDKHNVIILFIQLTSFYLKFNSFRVN